VKPTDPTDLGNQYVFIGIDATRKAIISYLVGKRDGENANAFLAGLRQRIVNRPEISSDGFSAYPDAVERAFGIDCSFAQIIKQYQGEPAIDTARRYSPGVVVGVQRRWVVGAQRKISTSYVEQRRSRSPKRSSMSRASHAARFAVQRGDETRSGNWRQEAKRQLRARLYNSGRFRSISKKTGWWFKHRPLPEQSDEDDNTTTIKEAPNSGHCSARRRPMVHCMLKQ